MRKTALIPIDIQRGFDLPPWGRRNNPDMEPRGLRLLQAWRRADPPIFHVRHDSIAPGSPLRPGQIGNAFRPGFEPLDGEPVIAKSVNCAFIGTDLELRLRRARIDRLAGDRALARRLGAAGAERVAEIHWDGVVERLLAPLA
mgnify:CR=1 FL=1